MPLLSTLSRLHFPLLVKALGLRASRAALAAFLCSPWNLALCAPLACSLLTATRRVADTLCVTHFA
eukprot:781813-Pleurochrysis_carterae.AAC.1